MCFSYYKTYREIEYSSRNMMVYFKRLRSLGFVSLEAFKMYYVMRTFAPSLHRKSTDFLILYTYLMVRISLRSPPWRNSITKDICKVDIYTTLNSKIGSSFAYHVVSSNDNTMEMYNVWMMKLCHYSCFLQTFDSICLTSISV